jgi:hypothetical protein
MRGCLFLATLATALMTAGCHIGLLMVAAGGALDQGPYRAETIATELGPTSVRTLGCLDVGLAVYQRGPNELLDVHVGNRCGYPEALEVKRLRIHGVDEEGVSHDVTLYDPKNEIVRLHVGGAERGKERLKLQGAHELTRLCFDLQAIAPDVPAARPAPLCLERGAGWRPAPIPPGGFT